MRCECGKDLFLISLLDCEDCVYNAAYDPDTGEYTQDSLIIQEKDLELDRAEIEGYCDMGEHTSGDGCYLFDCGSCYKKINLPLRED